MFWVLSEGVLLHPSWQNLQKAKSSFVTKAEIINKAVALFPLQVGWCVGVGWTGLMQLYVWYACPLACDHRFCNSTGSARQGWGGWGVCFWWVGSVLLVHTWLEKGKVWKQ